MGSIAKCINDCKNVPYETNCLNKTKNNFNVDTCFRPCSRKQNHKFTRGKLDRKPMANIHYVQQGDLSVMIKILMLT